MYFKILETGQYVHQCLHTVDSLFHKSSKTKLEENKNLDNKHTLGICTNTMYIFAVILLLKMLTTIYISAQLVEKCGFIGSLGVFYPLFSIYRNSRVD